MLIALGSAIGGRIFPLLTAGISGLMNPAARSPATMFNGGWLEARP